MYTPWWQRLSKPTFAERFELGGLAKKRLGFSRGTTLASAPWFRGTSYPGTLKAPRGYTGMADILKHEGAAIGALTVNQLNKAKKDKEKKKSEEDPSILKRPDPKDPKEIDKLLESIKLANELRKLKKEKDRQIFDKRMHGEAGGKGTFTGLFQSPQLLSQDSKAFFSSEAV